MAWAISGAILAGGQSRRMGFDKAALLVNGEPLLRRTVRLIRRVTPTVAVVGPVARATLAPDVPVIPDRWPNCGPLGGIGTALEALMCDAVLVVGCDMPFLNPVLLRYLVTLAATSDVVTVRLNGQAHPLHAVYQRRCLQVVKAQLAAGDLRLQHFLAQLQVRYVEPPELDGFDPAHLSVFNANTPAEWQQALALLEQLRDT